MQIDFTPNIIHIHTRKNKNASYAPNENGGLLNKGQPLYHAPNRKGEEGADLIVRRMKKGLSGKHPDSPLISYFWLAA